MEGICYFYSMKSATSPHLENLPGDESTMRVTVVSYSAEEIIRNFLALYHCMDFKAELNDIGIGAFQFSRRKKAIREFQALSIALWGLALQKSFPENAEDFFQEFLVVFLKTLRGGKKGQLLHNRVNIYVDLLHPKKDTDFQPVATYLAEVLALSAGDMPRLRLKLSLLMRNLYSMIFDKLV